MGKEKDDPCRGVWGRRDMRRRGWTQCLHVSPASSRRRRRRGRKSERKTEGLIALPRVGRGTQGDTGESVLASLSRRAEDSLCWPLSTACGSGTFCALIWEILSLFLSLSLSLSETFTLPLLLLLLCFVQKSFWFYLLLYFAVLGCFFSKLFWRWAERGRCESSEWSWALCHQGSAAHFHLHSYTRTHTYGSQCEPSEREKGRFC